MINYFIRSESAEAGPFNIAQLKCRDIKKDTFIWYAGLKDWCAARDIFELQELFSENRNRIGLPLYRLMKPGKKY